MLIVAEDFCWGRSRIGSWGFWHFVDKSVVVVAIDCCCCCWCWCCRVVAKVVGEAVVVVSVLVPVVVIVVVVVDMALGRTCPRTSSTWADAG